MKTNELDILDTIVKFGFKEIYSEIENRLSAFQGKEYALVRESILILLQDEEKNGYCFIAHSSQLMSLGIKESSILELLRTRSFKSIGIERPWELVLMANSKILDEAEYENLKGFIDSVFTTNDQLFVSYVILLSKVLSNINHLQKLDPFQDSILKCDPNILKSSDIIKYYETNYLKDGSINSTPVITICMNCKNFKTSGGNWISFEKGILLLPEKPTFTHGVCEDCLNNKYKKASLNSQLPKK